MKLPQYVKLIVPGDSFSSFITTFAGDNIVLDFKDFTEEDEYSLQGEIVKVTHREETRVEVNAHGGAEHETEYLIRVSVYYRGEIAR